MPEAPASTPKCVLIEMVLDIDCDFPPGTDFVQCKEAAFSALRAEYPRQDARYREHFHVDAREGKPLDFKRDRQPTAFRFHAADDKALVQFRTQGFSFNRLAPYPGFVSLLPEIQRTWDLFRSITLPVGVRELRQRYINRLFLPKTDGKVQLEDYLRHHPSLPDEAGLEFTDFINQHQAVEPETGCRATIVLATQPAEKSQFCLLFDITAISAPGTTAPGNWEALVERMAKNRDLANRIFRNTLKESCLNHSPL
jgi:uncharacterized protein (TIGR04255 family)